MTKTIAEMELFIASMEVECPGPDGLRHGKDNHCPECSGTGSKPRFPSLRRECPTDSYHLHQKTDPGSCQGCQGRGWTVISAEADLNTWLVAFKELMSWQIWYWEPDWWVEPESMENEGWSGPAIHSSRLSDGIVSAAYEALK